MIDDSALLYLLKEKKNHVIHYLGKKFTNPGIFGI
jgi:hypothetical protein